MKCVTIQSISCHRQVQTARPVPPASTVGSEMDIFLWFSVMLNVLRVPTVYEITSAHRIRPYKWMTHIAIEMIISLQA
jgi:hypothetical protein